MNTEHSKNNIQRSRNKSLESIEVLENIFINGFLSVKNKPSVTYFGEINSRRIDQKVAQFIGDIKEDFLVINRAKLSLECIFSVQVFFKKELSLVLKMDDRLSTKEISAVIELRKKCRHLDITYSKLNKIIRIKLKALSH